MRSPGNSCWPGSWATFDYLVVPSSGKQIHLFPDAASKCDELHCVTTSILTPQFDWSFLKIITTPWNNTNKQTASSCLCRSSPVWGISIDDLKSGYSQCNAMTFDEASTIQSHHKPSQIITSSQEPENVQCLQWNLWWCISDILSPNVLGKAVLKLHIRLANNQWCFTEGLQTFLVSKDR